MLERERQRQNELGDREVKSEWEKEGKKGYLTLVMLHKRAGSKCF